MFVVFIYKIVVYVYDIILYLIDLINVLKIVFSFGYLYICNWVFFLKKFINVMYWIVGVDIYLFINVEKLIWI